MSRLGLLLLLLAAPVLSLQGCGGSSGNSPPKTPRCILPSDCSGLLMCAQGFCVQQCASSKDCTNQERCVTVTVNDAPETTCQPPEKTTCVYNSQCISPQVCGVDLQCRSQCQTGADCPSGQVCTSITKLCADPTIDKDFNPATNDFNVVADGGSSTVTPGLDGGAIDAGGSSPDVTANTPDVNSTGADAGRPDAPAAVDSAAAVDAGAIDSPGVTSPDAALTFDAPALAVDGTVVTPSPSVRQGQINVTITITRASGGLATAGLFELGDATVRAQSGSTDTSLVLKASFPHGAVLGKRTLTFATSTGVVTVADVVEVTAITAGPTGADTNAGSAGSPFLTLKQAILVADTGDTIHLMDGTYNAKGGETWGYVIPNNLTIVGDSTAGTIIDGVGATTNPNGFNASTGLSLSTLTLQHFYYGIDMKLPSSTLSLQDVVLGGNSQTAIYVEQAATGSTVTIAGKNGLIDQPGQEAISVYYAPNVTVNITDATVQGGSYVIDFSGDCSGSKLNISGATIKELATYDAIYLAISSNAVGTTATLANATVVGTIYDSDPKGSLTITGSTLTQKYGDEIDFSALNLSVATSTITMTAANTGISFTGTQATMSLDTVTITGGGYGIQQSGTGSSAKVRGTTIQTTNYDDYYLTAGDLDLGTGTDSGDNTLGAPTSTSYYCLDIYRPQGAAAGNPVTCSGTTLNGQAPSPATIDASAGTINVQPQRYYLSTGNKLIFY